MVDFTSLEKPFIIAEIGANHNGDIALAKKMIDVAKECGADAVKFQSWDTTIFSRTVYEKNFFLGDDYRNRSDFTLKEIVEEFAVTLDEMRKLRDYCQDIGIVFSTTPFNVEQLQQLVELKAPYIKIASMDLTNPWILRAAGESGLPILLSTGFGALEEIDRAVRTVEETGNTKIVILHCVSLYPPEDEEVNLNNIDMLKTAFGYPVGFSDHTLGTELPIGAISKGAVVVEKHFTLDKEMFGWDHKMSCTPEELRTICTARDRLAKALGAQRRTVGAREMQRREEYRRSIVARRDIKAGEAIAEADLDFRRPGTGLNPFLVDIVIGCTAARDIAEDTLVRLEDLNPARG